MSGAQTFAMHDTDAQLSLSCAVLYKVSESRLGLGHSHTVQIYLRLNGVAAARELAHGATANGLAMKAHALGIAAFHGVDICVQALVQYFFLIGTGEASLRFRLVRFGLHTGLATQGFGSRHGTAEQLVIIFAQSWLLRLWCTLNIEYSERVPSRQTPPTSRMKILVSNDDGYLATGINVLTDALAEIADVVVVAPDRNRSAASNSLTLHDPLRVSKVAENRYKVNGTPSDCVHLALTGFLEEEPDLVVSGINHGANLGDDVIYSGTVAAAMEGRFLGLPTIAVSLVSHKMQHFDTAARVAAEFVQRLGRKPLPSEFIFNINVPDRPYDELTGVTVARLGFRHKSEPVVKSSDPHGRTIYWVGPAGKSQDAGEGTDFHAIDRGAVAVTPLKVDLTRYEALSQVSEWLQDD